MAKATPRTHSPLAHAEDIVSEQRRLLKGGALYRDQVSEYVSLAELVLGVAAGAQSYSASPSELLSGTLAIADANGCGPMTREIAAMTSEISGPVRAAAAASLAVSVYIIAFAERLQFPESGPGSLGGFNGNGWLTHVRQLGDRRIANLPPEKAVFIALRDELFARGAAKAWSAEEFVGIQKLSGSLLRSVAWGPTAETFEGIVRALDAVARANGLTDRLPIKPAGPEMPGAMIAARKAIDIAVASIEWHNGKLKLPTWTESECQEIAKGRLYFSHLFEKL